MTIIGSETRVTMQRVYRINRHWATIRVYGTAEEGLFMLVPVHSNVDSKGVDYNSYYQCEVVRVNGGYNHGDFGEKSPIGSNDCIVLVCKKASKIPPSRDLIVITAGDTAQRERIGYR